MADVSARSRFVGWVAASAAARPMVAHLERKARAEQARAEHEALELAREEATSLWKRNRRTRSIDVLRRTLLSHPAASATWHVYGARLLEVGRGDAAFEALKNCVELDPLALDALELYNELARTRDTGTGYARAAMDRMALVIADRPTKHREALDFLVPARRTDILLTLAESPDRLVRAVVMLNTFGRPSGDWASEIEPLGLTEDEKAQAMLVYALARGRVREAISLMERMSPADLPARSVRRAVRRALTKGDVPAAHDLLEHYLRASPTDRWAGQKYRETQGAVLTDRELTLKGFPFPARGAEPSYGLDPSRSLCLLHNSLPYHSAGYATRTQGLLTALRADGWRVDGVTRLGYPYDMDGFKYRESIPVLDTVGEVDYRRMHAHRLVIPKNPLQHYVERYAAEVEHLARTEKPFVIHAASNYVNGLAAIAAANQLGLASVYEVRGLWEVTRGSRDPEWAAGEEYAFQSRMEADAARHATEVITITEALARELVIRGTDPEKITVVPNGVDVDTFSPLPRRSAARKRVAIVGRIEPRKGVDIALEALAPFQDLEIDIVGDGPDAPAIRALARSLGMLGRTRFRGHVTDVHAALGEVDLVVSGARKEGLGLALLEAMAARRLVVATPTGGVPEFLQEGRTGFLAANGSKDALSRAVSRALAVPGATTEAILDRAATLVVSRFSVGAMCRAYAAIYRELLAH